VPRHPITLALLAFACAVRADAQDAVQVPRGGAITIDGRVDDAEWRNALRIAFSVTRTTFSSALPRNDKASPRYALP
jgi:hypothetical protein